MVDNKYAELLYRLKSCRIVSGFKSARTFATTFCVPEKTYSQHESGSRKISIESLLEYSEHLKIDPYWLLSGNGFPSNCDDKNEAISDYLYNNYGQKLILPKLYTNQKSQIDGKLLSDVLSKIIDLISNHNIKIDCSDLVEFVYSVYNSILDSNTDEQTKSNLIDLATKSLLTGTQAKNNNIKNIKTS